MTWQSINFASVRAIKSNHPDTQVDSWRNYWAKNVSSWRLLVDTPNLVIGWWNGSGYGGKLNVIVIWR